MLLPLDIAFDGLPGVFTNNPHRGTVNVPLWTLPIEVPMYAALLALPVATRLLGSRRQAAFIVFVAIAFGYCAVRHFANWHGTVEASDYRMPFMFFSGAAAAVFARRVVFFPAIRVAAAVRAH